jgi:hypothetical protein
MLQRQLDANQLEVTYYLTIPERSGVTGNRLFTTD